ncbi:hypothetical protein GCA01S_054_00470 [Parageobacillus caldoxylosilyticus NBRC 107762]|uniref:Uncharacterized protein n=2 Tax=Saccharococcus caldoxylosilyticus TaxID=81408 RepID=A0A023DIB2_9BACL|nr:hypothetical protein GCA01S_054_00470 [Parageobacillus caldoxylosilyticus NBRC 107762]
MQKKFCLIVPTAPPFTRLVIFAIMKETEPSFRKGGIAMRTLLVLGVIIAFLSAIFTAGYEDKPGVKN